MFALHHAQSQRSGNLGSIRIVDMKSIVKSVPVNQWKYYFYLY